MRAKNIKLIVLLIAVLFLIYNVEETYSRYVSNAEGEVTINFAKWQILVNNENISSNYESKLKFTPVIEDNVNMASNVLGPTSTGYFDVEINAENVETSFTYNIQFTIPTDSDIKNVVMTDYAITNEEELTLGNELTKIPLNGSTSISNTMNWDSTKTNFKFNKFIVRIYFTWDDNKENMSDEEDTIIGIKAANDEDINFYILATIKFAQYLDT
jgi:hypothetical protein